MFSLTAVQQEYLLSQPESGMGYQLVEVLTDSNQSLLAIAHNAELVLAVDEPNRGVAFNSFAAGLTAMGEATCLREIKVCASGERRSPALSVGEARGDDSSSPGPAKDAPPLPTSGGEIFKRYSAFENDRRIRADGSVMPGTYGTTEADARNVHTGNEAVARYALPNPAPAVNVFTIAPGPATLVQSGIVEPAYQQPGGGAEVIFTLGTAAGTVAGPAKIPPG